MCTSTNAIIVEDVVNEFIDEGKSFTAWDVTKEAKKRGADESHWHLKQAVHALFLNGAFSLKDYTRSLINIASPPPFLYHPVTEDPQNYEDAVLNRQSGSTPTDGVQTTPISVDDDDGDDCVDRNTDSTGRLCLPKNFLLELSLTPNDVVDVFVNHDNISVYAHDANQQPDTILKVNADGRVRISPSTLKRRGSFKVSLDRQSGAITVK